MNDPTRRDALRIAAAAGIAAVASTPAAAQAVAQESESAEELDRKRVLDAGMTDEEAECWILLNRAVAKFLQLPKLHPSYDREVELMAHHLQKELLMRPTYRRYRGVGK